jgi:hypothetical protein
MKFEKEFAREMGLILIGAIISAASVLITTYISDTRSDKKMNIQKKLELNGQLSRDLGKRFFVTFELYRKKRDKDSSVNTALFAYHQSKEEWNFVVDSYQSLINFYYGETMEKDFIKFIYNPLVKFGQQAEYSTYASGFANDFYQLRDRNIEFISQLYKSANE